MVLNTLSLALYLADLAHFALIRHGCRSIMPGGGWPDSFFVLFTLLGISIVAAVFGVFGRGTARVLTTANGVLLWGLWYLLGLGTSL